MNLVQQKVSIDENFYASVVYRREQLDGNTAPAGTQLQHLLTPREPLTPHGGFVEQITWSQVAQMVNPSGMTSPVDK